MGELYVGTNNGSVYRGNGANKWTVVRKSPGREAPSVSRLVALSGKSLLAETPNPAFDGDEGKPAVHLLHFNGARWRLFKAADAFWSWAVVGRTAFVLAARGEKVQLLRWDETREKMVAQLDLPVYLLGEGAIVRAASQTGRLSPAWSERHHLLILAQELHLGRQPLDPGAGCGDRTRCAGRRANDSPHPRLPCYSGRQEHCPQRRGQQKHHLQAGLRHRASCQQSCI